MDRLPDFIDTKSEAELAERMKHALESGHPLVRAGAFDNRLLEAQKLASSLRSQAADAAAAWITARKLPEVLSSDDDFARGLDHINDDTLPVLYKMLTEGAFLKAFRLSEVGQNASEITLSQFVKIITAPEFAHDLLSADWRIGMLGTPPQMVNYEVARNRERFERLQALVPSQDWPRSAQHRDNELGRLRTLTRDFRDKYLAHFRGIDSSVIPHFDEVAKLIDLTLDLATDCVFLVKGASVAAEDTRKLRAEQAVKFWSHALEGPKQVWLEHQRLIASGARPHRPRS